MPGPLSQLFQTSDDDSVAEGSTSAQEIAFEADPSIDLSVDVGLELGGTHEDGDTTTTWSREIDIGADVSTSAVIQALVANESSDFSSDI